MGQLFYLTPEQLGIIRPYFSMLYGIARVDDLRVISGIKIVLYDGYVWGYSTTYLPILPGCILQMDDGSLTLPASKLTGQRQACSKKGSFPLAWDLTKRGVSNIDIPVLILGIDADC